MRKIQASGADGVFLGGLIDENGAQVIKDKVKVLGDNEAVKLYMPDGFTTQQTIDEAGVENTRGAFFTVASLPPDQFEAETAQEFIAEFGETLGGEPIDPYAIYGAQAAQVMLDAIAASDGSRGSVVESLFGVEVQGGFLGDFTFSEDGDPLSSGDVVAFTVWRGEEELEVETVMTPQQEVVDAALGG
jgi:branched-chain amino acid transport system substrate-binding protein